MIRSNVLVKWPDPAVADTAVIPLPLPYIEFNGEPRNATLASGTSSVKIARRSRFTTSYERQMVAWVFTPVEYYAFQTFWNDTLGCGSACFRMNVKFPLTSELTEWVCRFAGDGFNGKYLDGAWQVQAALELVGPYVISEAAPLENWAPYYAAPQPGIDDSDEDIPYLTSDGYEYEALSTS